MQYPCIVYNYDGEEVKYADGIRYFVADRYEITLITKDPMPDVVMEAFDELPFIRFNRHYSGDNLHHFAYTLKLKG